MTKKSLKWVALILFCIFSVYISVCILDTGLKLSELIPTCFHKVFIDRSSEFKVTEYLDLWFSALSIVVTSILSWLLLKVSIKSNEISEKISDLEKSRDTKVLNDNISFVYYQIIHSIKELHKLYVDYYILNKKVYRQIKIHSDWITILSNLQNVLSVSEIDIIYQLFVDVETVNNSKDDQYIIKDIYQKYMLPCFFNKVDTNYLDLEKINPLSMLRPEFISIIIFLLFSFKKNDLLIEQDNSKYKVFDTENNWFWGEFELSNGRFEGNVSITYKDVILDGFFRENSFSSGKMLAHYQNTFYDLYEIKYTSKKDFHVKLYDIIEDRFTGNLIVDANYKNNKFIEGFLTFKNKEELWKGFVKNNGNNYKMIKGTIYNRLVEDSTVGYSYDNDKEWKRKEVEWQESFEFDSECEKNILGYKVYEDFVYENENLIQRKNQKKENQYTFIDS